MAATEPRRSTKTAAKPAATGKGAGRSASKQTPAATATAAAAGTTAAAPREPAPSPSGDRLTVPKTYKLYLGGAFPRSESGRSYPVTDASGTLLAHAAQASRKDVRDAVSAAVAAFGAWSGATAYNRGQVLYRVAEVLQSRRDPFVDDVAAAEGLSRAAAAIAVDTAIDRWVWYAGWTDKITTVFGSVNPVAGPMVNFSTPVPAGVVGVLAPPTSSLLGLVDVLAPVLAVGATAVVLASQDRPLPAVGLGEVLATSDVPGGVANLLTGRTAELAPWLAAHGEITGLDLAGAPAELAADLERAAADRVARVLPRPAVEPDPTTPPGTARLRAWTELRTVWHPVGR